MNLFTQWMFSVQLRLIYFVQDVAQRVLIILTYCSCVFLKSLPIWNNMQKIKNNNRLVKLINYFHQQFINDLSQKLTVLILCNICIRNLCSGFQHIDLKSISNVWNAVCMTFRWWRWLFNLNVINIVHSLLRNQNSLYQDLIVLKIGMSIPYCPWNWFTKTLLSLKLVCSQG